VSPYLGAVPPIVGSFNFGEDAKQDVVRILREDYQEVAPMVGMDSDDFESRSGRSTLGAKQRGQHGQARSRRELRELLQALQASGLKRASTLQLDTDKRQSRREIRDRETQAKPFTIEGFHSCGGHGQPKCTLGYHEFWFSIAFVVLLTASISVYCCYKSSADSTEKEEKKDNEPSHEEMHEVWIRPGTS
jgi:hypothetical protein